MIVLSPLDLKLLVALKKGKHFKANPGELYALLPGVPEPEALASFRRVLGQEYVKKVDRVGPEIWLRITDAGMAHADIAIAEERKPTIVERLKSITMSNWIALAALIVSMFALIRSAP